VSSAFILVSNLLLLKQQQVTSFPTSGEEDTPLSTWSPSSSVERIECTTAFPSDSYTSYISLAIDGGLSSSSKTILDQTLRDVHRSGTALSCDPYQRTLTQAHLVRTTTAPTTNDKNNGNKKDVTVALFKVSVSSYNYDEQPKTSLEPPHPDFVTLEGKELLGETCLLSAIIDNEAYQGDCARYGCYCPAELLFDQSGNAVETTGVTEEQLVDLFQAYYKYDYGDDDDEYDDDDISKGKKHSYGEWSSKKGRRLSGANDGDSYGYYSSSNSGKKSSGKKSSGKKSSGKKSSGKKSGKKTSAVADVVDVKEVRPLACDEIVPFQPSFLFQLSEDPCTELSTQEAKQFGRRVIQEYNRFQFENCDVRRLESFELPVCQPAVAGRRRLFPYLFTSFGFSSGEVTAFENFRRRRQLLWNESQQPQNPGTLLSTQSSSSSSTSGDTGFVDYGAAFNGGSGGAQDNQCFCSAFGPRPGRGITADEFLTICQEVLLDVTDGQIRVLDVEEVTTIGGDDDDDDDTNPPGDDDDDNTIPSQCGAPRLFTQVINVIVNGMLEDDVVAQSLEELLETLLTGLSIEKCVKSFFQVYQVDLIYQSKEPATATTSAGYEDDHNPHSVGFAWALQFKVQYVLFGVEDGEHTALFKTHKFYGADLSVPSFELPALPFGSVLDNHHRNAMMEEESSTADAAAAPMNNDDQLRRTRTRTDSRKLETILIATECVCNADATGTVDMLPLLLVNRRLDEAICDDAIPGITFAMIVV